ncbi:MAG: porin, partial [Methylocella sp.]
MNKVYHGPERGATGAAAVQDPLLGRARARSWREGIAMKLFKGLLMGSAASLAGVTFLPDARAADLPARQAAPIEYVRICDAYGAGFFYIPGTDTCLRAGGLVLAELRGFNPSFTIAGPLFYGAGAQHLGPGFVPSPSEYTNARSRDAIDYAALGRVELDARTQSPWGALRSFIRVDAYYGSGGSAALGSLGQQLDTFNTTAGTSAPRETTILNKAFIQFAGLTAGYAQSMFDFYADAYNYLGLRGSNATV